MAAANDTALPARTSASIPPTSELGDSVLTFTQLARLLPRRRGNRPTHVSTLHRWRLVGLHGVKLAATKHGGIWITSLKAYERFVAELTHAASPNCATSASTKSTTSEQVDQKLNELGL